MNCKYIDYKLCKNNYNLSKEEIHKILVIIENFLDKLSRIQFKELSFNDKISLLGFYCDSYSLAKNKEDCISDIYNLLNDLKQNIEGGHVDISLFGGLTNIAMFIKPVVETTGYFKKFQKNINKLIVEFSSKQSTIYKNNLEWNRSSHFDVISGLSGVALYLFTLGDDAAKKAIKDIIEYFIALSEYRYSNDLLLPGWYIKGECLPTKEYREDFKEGCINYSLSHGIAGPLYILSKGICEKIEVEGQKVAIKRILEEYHKVGTYMNEICIWPGMMQLDEYLKNINSCSNLRMSWCYGSLGILQSILIAGNAINEPKIVDWTLDQFLKISNMPIQNYYLDSPIICHGYAGASTVFRRLYDRYKDERFLLRNKVILSILFDLYNPQFLYGYKDFRRINTEHGFSEEYQDKLTILEGTTGICLELIAFLKDRSFLERILFLNG